MGLVEPGRCLAEQSHGPLDVIAGQGEGYGGLEVVVLAGQAGAPLELRRPVHVGGEGGGEVDEMIGVAGSEGVGFAHLGQAFLRVLAMVSSRR